MNIFRVVFGELIDMFVDDGALAISTVATIALAMSARIITSDRGVVGAILVLGCMGALMISVARAVNKKAANHR